jgi:hypothetical protein
MLQRSHTRETDGHGSLAEENGMDQVYKDEKTSQDGTSSPVPPQTFDYQKEPAEEVGSLDEVKMEMSSFAQSSVQEPAEKVGSPNEVKIEMSSFAQPSVQASGSHSYDPLHITTTTSPGEFPPDDDGGKVHVYIYK